MLGLVQLTREAASVVAGNAVWMAWNLVLALVPLGLALRLFRGGGPGSGRAPRGLTWWAGALLFVLFLPNAPYVLSDVVHFYGDVRAVDSDAVLSVAVLPQYALFMLGGFSAYVASLLLVERWLDQVVEPSSRLRALRRSARPLAHAGSAVGIYLGRFVRLNSWDAVVRPGSVWRAVADTFSLRGVLVLVLTFAVLTALTDAAAWAWGQWRTVQAWRRAA